MRVLAHQPVGPSRRWSVLPCCDAISSITNSPRPTGFSPPQAFRNPPPSRIPTQRPRSPPTRGPLAPPRRGRPSAAPRKGCRRHGRGPTVRPGCTGSPRTVRSPSRAGRRPSPHPAHDGAPRPKGPPTHRRTRNRAPPRRSRRAHRPGRAPAPSSHGRPATQSLSSRAWCKPLPTRDCQLNPTLTHTDEHNSPGEAPEGRAPQHEAESAPGWTGQQRRSTRNRRGVTTVPASVSLGQVMMPTNPEMLQRSAERA